MIRLFTLIFLLSSGMIAQAQKDRALPKNNDSLQTNNLKQVRLTSSQQQWMNRNYKSIAGLTRDSAAKLIRKNFTTINESSIEYLISQAAKLQKSDNQQELAMLEQMLGQLKQQKQALSKKLMEKEAQLSKEKDTGKIKAISNEILELKKQLRELEDNIRGREENVRKIKSNS